MMQQPYGYAPNQPLPSQGPAAAAPPVPQQQFDPTAQLNSLMNMLNQQQQQQQQS